MMDDRTLLERAAKAAGVEVYESTDGTIQNRPILVFSAGGRMGTMPYEVQWNPLLEDAQEARLEGALCFNVSWGMASVTVDSATERYSDHGGDKQKARRRAGVRAAAAMGGE